MTPTVTLGSADPVRIDLGGDATVNPPQRVFVALANVVAYDMAAERRVPLMISSEQEYYWTFEWQEGEQRAVEEINGGNGHVFETPKEAIRWLLSEESE